jgi:hypothetical protein
MRSTRRRRIFFGFVAFVLSLPIVCIEATYYRGIALAGPLPAAPLPNRTLTPIEASVIWISFGESLPAHVDPIRLWRNPWLAILWSGPRTSISGHGWNAANQISRFVSRRPELQHSSNRMIASGSVVVWLTQHWTADDVTRFGAENLYLGRGATGFEAGARAYFGAWLSQLTPAQLALLGTFPQAPSRDLIKSAEKIRARRDAILRSLAAADLLTPEELRIALDSPLTVLPPS